MRVIGWIAWQECRLAWRTRAVVALGAVLTVLTVATAIAGQARYAAEQAQRDRYQALVGRQFADQPDRHPHRVSHYGYLLFRPRAPLGFFDSGLESFAGTSLFLEAHRQNTANFSGAAQGGDRFGELTLASLLQLFVPIFLFATAGVSITREREDGTLSLLLAQGVSWGAILWGKLAGTLLTLAAVLSPGLLLSAAWLAASQAGSGGPAWDADASARAAALVVVHAGFLTTCAALAVAVSAWQATSRGALTVLVGCWFALWIVVPRVLPAVSEALHPTPTRAAFESDVEARLKELGDSHDPDDPVFARLREDTLRQHGVSRVEDLPFNYGGLVMKEGEAATTAAVRQHQEQLEATYARQARLLAGAALASPYLAVRLVSMGLSGADLPHLLEFERQAEAFRYALIQSLNDLHMTEVAQARDRYGAVVNGAPTRQRIDAAHFDRLPTFDFRRPGVAWALRQQRDALAGGVVAMGAALAAVAWLARRP